MQSVWIILTVAFVLWVAWHVGKGERKAPPAPDPVYPDRKPEEWPSLRWNAEDEGLYGERMLVDRLEAELDPARFAVLHDVWLRVRRGGTTQIDCVVVCPACVVALEVKSRHCQVWGRPGDDFWTLKYGYKLKVPMENPRIQNQGHVADLRENFAEARRWDVRSIVAFADDARFMRPMPPNVLHFSEVPDAIRRMAALERRDPLDVASVAAEIRARSDEVTPEERAAHVEELKRRWERTRNA